MPRWRYGEVPYAVEERQAGAQRARVLGAGYHRQASLSAGRSHSISHESSTLQLLRLIINTRKHFGSNWRIWLFFGLLQEKKNRNIWLSDRQRLFSSNSSNMSTTNESGIRSIVKRDAVYNVSSMRSSVTTVAWCVSQSVVLCFSACPSKHSCSCSSSLPPHLQLVSMWSSAASGAPPSDADGWGLEAASSSRRW